MNGQINRYESTLTVCVNSDNPNWRDFESESFTLTTRWDDSGISHEDILFLSFSVDDRIFKRKIKSANLSTYSIGSARAIPIIEPIIKEIVSYENQPKSFPSPVFYTNVSPNKAPSTVANQVGYFEVYSNNTYDHFGQFVNVLKYGISVNDRSGNSPSIIYGYHSQHRPALNVTSDDVELVATNPIPAAGGFVDRSKAARFTWDVTYDTANVPGVIYQKSATIRWRPKGTESYTEVHVGGDEQEFIFAENTFSSGYFEWCISILSDDDVQGEFSEWIEFSTVDSTSTAIPISPVDMYFDVNEAQLFTWKHIISSGSPQTKFDLQYSDDAANWVDIQSETTDRENYLVPAGTLPTGKLFWRVRTYNADGVGGEWSNPASIIGIGKPKPPRISNITNQARPNISWQTDDQIAFRVQVYLEGAILVDSMETAGSIKSYQIPEYLNDGRYTFRVCIKNSNGQLSDWSTASAKITTTKPTPPIVTGRAVENAAYITAQLAGEISRAYLLRDGVPIANFTGAYYDYSEIGEHEYAIRVINADDNFADSEPVFVKIDIKCVAQIAPEDDLSNIVPLKFRRGEPAALSAGIEPTGENMYFAGRRYPVYEFSEFLSETHESSFSVRSQDEWRRIKELAQSRKTVLYRDIRGNCFYCIISALQFDQDWYTTDFSISLLRVDRVDRIEYAAPEV